MEKSEKVTDYQLAALVNNGGYLKAAGIDGGSAPVLANLARELQELRAWARRCPVDREETR